jgi:hypothetical protein
MPPWRDDDELLADSPRGVGDQIEIDHGDEHSRGTWQIADVRDAPDGEPDTLVMWKPARPRPVTLGGHSLSSRTRRLSRRSKPS